MSLNKVQLDAYTYHMRTYTHTHKHVPLHFSFLATGGANIIDPKCVSTQLSRGDGPDNRLINTKSPL